MYEIIKNKPPTEVIAATSELTIPKGAMHLWPAVVVAAVIGSVAVACLHNGAATADRGNATNYVVGQDGKLIGAAPNPSIRSQWEREGLPN
jgi:hypothetical protein